MAIILILVYIGLTRLVMWIFEDTTVSWTIRIFVIILINAAAFALMYEYIDEQFEPIREVARKYNQHYEDLKKK